MKHCYIYNNRYYWYDDSCNKKSMNTWFKTIMPTININNCIERVKFNNPATIVWWKDGTKTVVKCQPGDTFDEEKGLLAAIAKKISGGNKFNEVLKKWCPIPRETIKNLTEEIVNG